MIDPDDPQRRLVYYTRNGKVFKRRNRIDNIDPSRCSPARRQAMQMFAQAARTVKGGHPGRQEYNGVFLPVSSIAIANNLKGLRMGAQHIDRKAMIRDLLDRMEKESGSVPVTGWGKLLAVVHG